MLVIVRVSIGGLIGANVVICYMLVCYGNMDIVKGRQAKISEKHSNSHSNHSNSLLNVQNHMSYCKTSPCSNAGVNEPVKISCQNRFKPLEVENHCMANKF